MRFLWSLFVIVPLAFVMLVSYIYEPTKTIGTIAIAVFVGVAFILYELCRRDK